MQKYCEAHLYGLYLLNGKSHIDNHTLVDNVKPNCFSNEFYKGIIDDNATGVFNGKIFVQPRRKKQMHINPTKIYCYQISQLLIQNLNWKFLLMM